MGRLSKRKRSIKEVTKERERQRKARKIQEERGWESSEVEEDVTALGLLQRSGAGSASNLESASEDSESEIDEVLVSEGEEQEEVDESAFGKLMAGAVEQSRCVFHCQVPNTRSSELTIYHWHVGKQTSGEAQF